MIRDNCLWYPVSLGNTSDYRAEMGLTDFKEAYSWHPAGPTIYLYSGKSIEHIIFSVNIFLKVMLTWN